MTKQQYLNKYYEAAKIACEGSGIFPLVLLGQRIMENGWTESDLGDIANNFFGIKSTESWEKQGGKFVIMPTHEFTEDRALAELPLVTRVRDGKTYYRYTIQSKFRKYDTLADGFKDYVHFVLGERYKKSGVLKARSENEQITAIANAGYASAPDYAEKIISIMNGLKMLLPK